MRHRNDSWFRLGSWWETFRRQLTAVFDPYRPELHYMRGRGPRWREKHARHFPGS